MSFSPPEPRAVLGVGALRRRDLDDIRASIRRSAEAVAEDHRSTMDAARIRPHTMRAPPPLERGLRAGESTEQLRGDAGYDWFYGLSRAEQSRLRSNWMAPASRSTAERPDEVFERMPAAEWLRHTRVIDASEALATGRHVAPGRYGGLDPNSLIHGTPYDVRAVFGPDHKRALAHVRAANTEEKRRERRESQPSDGAQFFTDEAGVVHPIRASLREKTPTMHRHQIPDWATQGEDF